MVKCVRYRIVHSSFFVHIFFFILWRCWSCCCVICDTKPVECICDMMANRYKSGKKSNKPLWLGRFFFSVQLQLKLLLQLLLHKIAIGYCPFDFLYTFPSNTLAAIQRNVFVRVFSLSLSLDISFCRHFLNRACVDTQSLIGPQTLSWEISVNFYTCWLNIVDILFNEMMNGRFNVQLLPFSIELAKFLFIAIPLVCLVGWLVGWRFFSLSISSSSSLILDIVFVLLHISLFIHQSCCFFPLLLLLSVDIAFAVDAAAAAAANAMFLLLLPLQIFPKIDGGLKMRSWANGGTHLNGQLDHMSTLSRPRSIEAISNGTLPNNIRNCNGILSRGSGLHEDSDFPPNYTKSLSRRKPIVWMRPHVSRTRKFRSPLTIDSYPLFFFPSFISH